MNRIWQRCSSGLGGRPPGQTKSSTCSGLSTLAIAGFAVGAPGLAARVVAQLVRFRAWRMSRACLAPAKVRQTGTAKPQPASVMGPGGVDRVVSLDDLAA